MLFTTEHYQQLQLHIQNTSQNNNNIALYVSQQNIKYLAVVT